MQQPDEYETTRRLSSKRPLSMAFNRVPTTERVQIQITQPATRGTADIEKTLKRGLEARQVSTRLPSVWNKLNSYRFL